MRSLRLPRRVNCAALGLPRHVNICSLLALVRSPLACDARRWPLALAAHQLSPPTPAVPNHGVQAGARRAGVGGDRTGVAGARRAQTRKKQIRAPCTRQTVPCKIKPQQKKMRPPSFELSSPASRLHALAVSAAQVSRMEYTRKRI